MPDGSENLPWPDEEPRDDAPQDQEVDDAVATIESLVSLADLLADLMNGPARGDEHGRWPHPFTPQFE